MKTHESTNRTEDRLGTTKVSVTVTEMMRRGKKVWRLRRRIDGKIERKFFETWLEADQARHQTLEQLEARGTESFTQARGLTVTQGVKDFLAARRASLRGNHLRLVEWWLGEFKEKHGAVDLGAVSARTIDAFLARKGWSGTTRAQGYVYLRLFFNWLVRYDYIEKSPVLKAEVPRKTAVHHLLSVAEVERLLELTAGDSRLRAWLVLGVFGGMRQSEVGRALREHVGETEILVPVTKSTDAVPRKRFVPIQPALVRHLPEKWDCLDEWHVKRPRQRLVEEMGWKEWPQNCLRHTAASMHLAQWQDAGKTAFFLGHSSPQMVNKTYARAVPQADAERFWGL
jgi:integrase